jgi:TP901 family phage tail tape measure protein
MANELVVNIAADTQDLESGLADIKQNLAIVSQSLIDFGGKISEAFTGIMEGVFESQEALGKFQNQTGSTADLTKKYGKEIADVYKNNWGESIEDVSASMATVKQQSNLLGISSVKDIKGITENALTLRDTFEFEVKESTRAAGAMVQNFGIDSKQAFDLIAKGAQSGLDKSDDMLDTLNEYSPLFSMIGLDANDMFSILKKGSESGVFTVDKVADSIAEFQKRVTDSSSGTKEAMTSIGLDSAEMSKAFLEGGAKGKEAFNLIIESLGKVKDPIKQREAGIALMGTMWEDVGAKAILSMAKTDKSFANSAGTIEKIDANVGKQFRATWATMSRTIELDLIQPLGEAVLPALKEVGKVASQYLPMISSAIKNVNPAIITTIAVIAGLVTALIPIIGIVGTLMPAFAAVGAAIAAISTPVLIAIGVIAAIIAIVILFRNQIASAFNFISTNVMPVLGKAWDYISQKIMGVIMPIINQYLPQLQAAFNTIWSAISGIISIYVSSISSQIGFVMSHIKNMEPVLQFIFGVFSTVFSGIFRFVVATFTGIVEIIGSVMNIIKGIINVGMGIITGDWKRAFDGCWDITKNVFNIIISVFNWAFATIRSVVTIALSTVINTFKSIFPQAYNAVHDVFSSIINYISSVGSSLYDAGSKIINQLIQGIKDKIGEVRNACKNVAKAIADFFPHSPAKEGALKDFPETGYNLMNQLMEGIESQKKNVMGLVSEVTQGVTNNVAVSSNNNSGVNNSIVIPIYLDGKKITEVVAPQMTKMIRMQGGY